MRRGFAWVAAVPLLLSVAAAPSHAAAAQVEVSWTVVDPSGTVEVRIDNNTSGPLDGWEVTLPLEQPVTDVSGAISIQDSEHLTLSASQPLSAGQSAQVRLVVEPLGTLVTSPAWCSSPDATCDVASDPTPAAAPGESTASGDLELNYRVASDWGEGQAIVMSVTNNGTTATSGWQVEVSAGVHVSGMWGADNLSGGGQIRAANDGTNGYLAPGETIEFGFDVAPGRNGEWSQCRAVVDGMTASCGVTASTSWAAYPQLPSPW